MVPITRDYNATIVQQLRQSVQVLGMMIGPNPTNPPLPPLIGPNPRKAAPSFLIPPNSHQLIRKPIHIWPFLFRDLSCIHIVHHL